MKILSSASRIVFILMAIASIALTFRGMLDPKDFFALVMMAFMHYFKKGDDNLPTV